MCAPDPFQPFDLKQIAQYVLIFGRPGLENTWQGIAFDFAYRMHWQTLFGFTLCQALCATSAAKPAVVRQLALVIVQPGMYQEVVASYNAVFPDQPMVVQYGFHLNLMQCDEERALSDSPEAKGLYYYIGIDPNQVHLWKCMAAHGPLPPVPTATNIAPMESLVVAATTVSGPSASPGPVPASQEPATNIAPSDVTMALESEEVPEETAGSGP
ncbi:hypothetical protein C0995_014652 [Termitomyces sp. Mi166|nr:hypothetical protein C0995_014652 [Termitomyces sp. Mi166\